MAVEGFNEIFNVIYIAKKLYDMRKYELVAESFFDVVDYDMYYENIYGLMAGIFEYHRCSYYENNYIDLHIVSDKVIVDFFILAGKYGKRSNIPDTDNPYIKAAHQEVFNNLNISHCLDWKLKGYT